MKTRLCMACLAGILMAGGCPVAWAQVIPVHPGVATMMCKTADGHRKSWVADVDGHFPACAPQSAGVQQIDLNCGVPGQTPERVTARCMLALP